MIPTLFGVTVVSFCIMQLAPGDPLLDKAGPGGMSGSGQTREAFLIQKRDLHLDKPLLLNFRSFGEHRAALRSAAWFLSHSPEEIQADLVTLQALDSGKQEAATPSRPPGTVSPPAQENNGATSSTPASRLAFLRQQKLTDLARQLADSQQHSTLARQAQNAAIVYCEDLGVQGVAAVFQLLDAPETTRQDRIGLIRCLTHMVVDPFHYTYSRDPRPEETAAVTGTWKLWWDRNRSQLPPVSPERAAVLGPLLTEIARDPAGQKVFSDLEKFEVTDVPFLAEKLLSEQTPLNERAIAAIALRLFKSDSLKLDVPLSAPDAELAEAVANWREHYQQNFHRYNPGWMSHVTGIFSDTQYAHMVWRLVTFNFGRSTLRTREPVSEKIWDAVQVSAPLMFLTEIVIYCLSIPLGVICAIRRDRLTDKSISLTLFLLYSIPPFVAGMMLQLLLCSNEYTGWMTWFHKVGIPLAPFPMIGLHSPEYDDYWRILGGHSAAAKASLPSFGVYLADYLWHAALPVACLSLFSLAGLAQYGRATMLDVLGMDYIRTARAKGLAEGVVVLKHALRNGLIPLITLFSSFLPALLGGSVLIEVLFGIPGMGRLSWNSIEQKDIPTLMALVYIDAIVVMLSILISDLLYIVVDPRISFSGRETA